MLIKRNRIVKIFLSNGRVIKGLSAGSLLPLQPNHDGLFVYSITVDKTDDKKIAFNVEPYNPVGTADLVIFTKEQINCYSERVENIETTDKFISVDLYRHPKIKCISVDIVKPWHGDCSNDGLSHKYNTAYMVVSDGYWEFDVLDDNCPENIVSVYYDADYGVYKSVPLFSDSPSPWYMFGGTHIYTSDQRFRKKCHYPIPLHDRIER